MDSFVRPGIFPSLFPMHTFYRGDWHRDHTVGPALADNISPTQGYLKRDRRSRPIMTHPSPSEDDSKGSIKVGKRADLVILSADPTAVDPETLDQLTVMETIKEGEAVYQATEKQGALGPMQDGRDPFAEFIQQAAMSMPEASGDGCGIDFVMTALEPALARSAASD